jgi:hypothetical protein
MNQEPTGVLCLVLIAFERRRENGSSSRIFAHIRDRLVGD